MNESLQVVNENRNDGGAIVLDYSKINSKKIVYRIIKRIFDLIVSIIGMALLLPIVLIVKIAYVLSGDFNSIFFTQKRIGLNGKEFTFYKFRTMIPNADAALEKLLKEDPARNEEYKINKKLKDDPRITKVGNVLRKTSLDELPQVFNIFLGEMACIGNRPYLPREKNDMGTYYNTIVSTKPGLTGYWEISLLSNNSPQKFLKGSHKMTTIESIALEQENNDKLTKVLSISEEKVAHKIKKAIYYTTKKIFDIICALIGCLMLIPVSIITKISYLLTGDKEPIFFTQKRIGKNGKEFNFYKFRTMIPNADEELKRILKEDKELAKEYKENKKMKHDPRITKMGGFLRKSSLDELPQFIKVCV